MELGLSKTWRKKLERLSGRNVLLAWYRSYRVLFILLFVAVLGYSAYQWYSSLYRYQWTEERRKTYVEEYFKQTSFKEAQYRALVERLKARAEAHQNPLPLRRNIFTGESLSEQ